MNPPEAAAVFVLAITAYASGPLIAPGQRRTPPRPTPSWARTRTEARRIARATRTSGDRT